MAIKKSQNLSFHKWKNEAELSKKKKKKDTEVGKILSKSNHLIRRENWGPSFNDMAKFIQLVTAGLGLEPTLPVTSSGTLST